MHLPKLQALTESKASPNSLLYAEAFDYFRFNCTSRQLEKEEAIIAKFKKNTKYKTEANTSAGEAEIYDALYTAKDDMAD